jgi:hypothetical protein
MTDALGGVRVQVSEDMVDPSNDWSWSAGEHDMDGEEALRFVRERKGLPGGDFDRVKRQQAFLKAVAEKDQWQEQWVMVIEVIAASSASLIVTSQIGSKIDLSANAELPDLLEDVAIADPSLGWTASSWKGHGSTSLCKEGTPLYHCIKVKRNWLGTLSTRTLGPEDDAALAAAFTDDPFE